MTKEEVVKGFEYEKDQYVTLTPDEIKAALPKCQILFNFTD